MIHEPDLYPKGELLDARVAENGLNSLFRYFEKVRDTMSYKVFR
jgi:hypothetical protein